jgi:hypothetical protein
MRNNNRSPDRGMGTGLLAAMGAAALVAALVIFIWAPWNSSRLADKSAPGTTVGSSTSRPAAPNTAPSPAAPADPSR